ncbi:MAG: hypothetical protein PUP93_14295 [Rhizonema sp. NSF051]|nr:hypothetical protein [Rhizonema sp. NSF051]
MTEHDINSKAQTNQSGSVKAKGKNVSTPESIVKTFCVGYSRILHRMPERDRLYMKIGSAFFFQLGIK